MARADGWGARMQGSALHAIDQSTHVAAACTRQWKAWGCAFGQSS